jgi:hypothetical protein
MKKLMLSVVLLFTAIAVFADEIYLYDGTVHKGTIIQITESMVEYDPDGPVAFDSIPRDRVARIKYAGGKEQRFLVDTLYMLNGDMVKCSIIKVTKDSIIYIQEGSNEEKTIGRDAVAKMEFSDGRVIELQSPDVNVPEQKDVVAQKQSGGYLDSVFRISIFGGGGGADGGIVDKERRVFKAYEPDLMLSAVFPIRYAQYTTFGTGGAEIEYLPPAIKFTQKKGFDFTGIKFGIRARYGYERIFSRIYERDNEAVVDSFIDNYGTLMRYHYWAAGPGMSFVFTPRSNAFSFMINMFCAAGQVVGGRLTPLTALRDSKLLWFQLAGLFQSIWNIPPFMAQANPYTAFQLNNTTVRGYTIRGGFGPEFAMNRHFPIIIGLHVTCSYTSLTLGRAPVMYADGNKKAAHYETGGEISIGMHF